MPYHWLWGSPFPWHGASLVAQPYPAFAHVWCRAVQNLWVPATGSSSRWGSIAPAGFGRLHRPAGLSHARGRHVLAGTVAPGQCRHELLTSPNPLACTGSTVARGAAQPRHLPTLPPAAWAGGAEPPATAPCLRSVLGRGAGRPPPALPGPQAFGAHKYVPACRARTGWGGGARAEPSRAAPHSVPSRCRGRSSAGLGAGMERSGRHRARKQPRRRGAGSSARALPGAEDGVVLVCEDVPAATERLETASVSGSVYSVHSTLRLKEL